MNILSIVNRARLFAGGSKMVLLREQIYHLGTVSLFLLIKNITKRTSRRFARTYYRVGYHGMDTTHFSFSLSFHPPSRNEMSIDTTDAQILPSVHTLRRPHV